MRTPVLVLLLLCVFSLFPLTEHVQQRSPEDEIPIVFVPVSPVNHTKLVHAVLYNVSDTGALIIGRPFTVIMSDHYGDITVSYSFLLWGSAMNLTIDGELYLGRSDPPRRVVFKLGKFRNFAFIPESSQMFVEYYFLEDLPKNADVISLVKLFGCRLGQTTYDSGFDLDGNNIINAQDIVIAIRNFRQIQARIP